MRHVARSLVFAGSVAFVWFGCAMPPPDSGGPSPGADAGGTTSGEAGVGVAPPPPLGLAGFALYAQRSITMGPRAQVERGDVGCVTRASEDFGPQVRLAEGSAVAGRVVSPTAALARGSGVGELDALEVELDEGARARRRGDFPATLPALPLAPVETLVDTTRFVLDTPTTLKPGIYGDVTIGSGVAVRLLPGVYDVQSLTLLAGASLTGDGGETTVDVLGAVTIGQRARIHARVSAPHGTLELGEGAEAFGAFAAFDIVVGDDARVVLEGGFATSGAAGKQTVTGVFGNPTDGSFAVVGPAPVAQIVHLDLTLPGKDPKGLVAMAGRVSDPKDPLYRHFLDFDAMMRSFMPSAAEYAALRAWADREGLTVETEVESHAFLGVSATIDRVERAFHVNLVVRERPGLEPPPDPDDEAAPAPDAGSFVTVDREPSIDVDVPLFSIAGFDEVVPAVSDTKSCCSKKPATCGCRHRVDQADMVGGKNGTGGDGLYTREDIRHAYLSDESGCLQGLLGDGERIGLTAVGLNGAFQQDDLHLYTTHNHISAIHPKTAFGTNPTMVFPNVVNPASDEPVLDIIASSNMAPNADIFMYFIAQGAPSVTGVCALAEPLPGTKHEFLSSASNSFSLKADVFAPLCLARMAIQGTSFFTASGDSGDIGDPENLKDIPLTTVVGGTSLITRPTHKDKNGNTVYPGNYYKREEMWNSGCPEEDIPIDVSAGHCTPVCNLVDEAIHCGLHPGKACPRKVSSGKNLSGGGIMDGTRTGLAGKNLTSCFPGICSGIPIPDYQQPAELIQLTLAPTPNEGSLEFRNFPDVAAIADDFEVARLLKLRPVGGTSGSAPTWAGVAALVDEQSRLHGDGSKLGFAAPTIYALGAASPPTSDASASRFINDVREGGRNSNNTVAVLGPNVCADPNVPGMEIVAGFPTVRGYDLTTGFGTPSCRAIKALAQGTAGGVTGK